jgi:MOSC domain-containing protein YiiM
MEGRVVSIAIRPAKGATPTPVREVRAVVGRGLSGDHDFDRKDAASDPEGDVTLIETEALDALARDYGLALSAVDSRRNLATRGVALNHLVGREFRVGGVRLRGVKLCEPCGHLEKVTGLAVRPGLVHRGGLRAQVLEGGVVREGDAVVPAEA